METSHHATKAVCFLSSFAVLAGMADILDGLESCSLADFEVLDSFSDFDDDACAFVTSTFGAELRPDGYQYLYPTCGS
jgi:hypothetical protein